MEIEEQFELGHLLLTERRCRSCDAVKDLIDGFYKIRKNRYELASSYSYECKECTIKRITKSRKGKIKVKKVQVEWEYPDW